MSSDAVLERDGETFIIRIPMDLKRRGGRKEILVPGEGPHAKPVTQEPLVTAIARAFHWQELLDGHRFGSISELADALAVDRSYVRRILMLATLAPDIVEAIVAGTEPSGLSLERLTRGLPVGWAEQRGRVGIGCGRRITSLRRRSFRADHVEVRSPERVPATALHCRA